MKYFQHEWAKLREYIEQRERDLVVKRKVDVDAEVAAIRNMYEEIRADIEANTPDRFVGMSSLKVKWPVSYSGHSPASHDQQPSDNTKWRSAEVEN